MPVKTQARTSFGGGDYGRNVGVTICSAPIVGIGTGVPDPTGWMYTL